MAQDGNLRKIRLRDGTVLCAISADNPDLNIHLNHWHVAADGTVLSVKESGSHRYKRSDVRRNINQVLEDVGFKLTEGWRPDQGGSTNKTYEELCEDD